MGAITSVYSPRMARPDLSLLPALDALLHERSVSKAAHRLGLSQPSLSAALARLRRHYDDPLLVRVGNTYELTPLAVRLLPRTEEALAATSRVYEASAQFDPSTTTRTFTVLGSDYAMAVVGRSAAAAFAESAPLATLRLEHHSTARVAEAAATLRQCDAMLLPPGVLTGFPSQVVAEDTWVLIADRDNAALPDAPTLADLGRVPWVLPYHADTALMPPIRQLQLLGIDPDVRLVVEGFLALPHHVRGTDRVSIMHRALADSIGLPTSSSMRMVEPPFDVVPAVEALWWHPVHHDDPEHAWLRGLFGDERSVSRPGPAA